ncbi:MAG TPA: chorismate mutase [Micavibrio sp.]
MNDSVKTLRENIDAVDDQIHDLLMKRADLVLEIGKEKRKRKEQIISPAREARVIRRLLDRHKGPLQKAAMVRIWRELVGAVSLLQTDMRVALFSTGPHAQEYADMARDYFGSVIPMHHVANPMMAISMVRDGEANFAVVPWPEDEAENPWWSYLVGNDAGTEAIRIMGRLPYGGWGKGRGNPEFRALVIARLAFNDSGKDHSFLLLDLDQMVSRARVVDKMKALGITALSINSRRVRGLIERSLHLFEVDSYISPDDPRLQQLLEKLENPEGRCIVVGGYPVLPLLGENTQAPGRKSA